MGRRPWEVSDELWAVVEPLLPRHERRARYPGRKRLSDRAALSGDPVRVGHGCAVAGVASRARLRVGGDLLAALGGVDAGWGVAGVAPRVGAPAAGG
jgi:hypothetical protein